MQYKSETRNHVIILLSDCIQVSALMAATVTNVNTAGVGDATEQIQIVTADSKNQKTHHFKRMCQHYMTNNNTSSVPVLTQHPSNAAIINSAFPSSNYVGVQEGWANIPFMNGIMAMNQCEWDALVANGQQYRVDSVGFRIFSIAATQQEVVTGGGTTSITSSFTQVPSILLFKDENNDMIDSTITPPVQTTVTVNNVLPIISFPGTANGTDLGNIHTFATSFTDGLLPNVQFLIPQVVAGGTFTLNDFELLNGGHVERLTSGSQFEYHWHSSDKERWMPFTNIMRDSVAVPSATASMTRYANPWASFSVLGATTGFNPVTNITQNVATEINRNMIDIPKMHLLRIPPLFNDAGPISLNMEIWIEYHMTVTVREGRYFQKRITNNTAMIPADILPYPQFSRSLYTGVIALADVDPELDSNGRDNRRRPSPYARSSSPK